MQQYNLVLLRILNLYESDSGAVGEMVVELNLKSNFTQLINVLLVGSNDI